ncbi:MAG: hypothetical protein NC240_11440 [Clostridium sp.]|nr:hypothetical protein [Clostridium sp.]
MKTNYKPQYTITVAPLKTREIFVEENGRLYTEEAIKLTNDIRKQIQKDKENGRLYTEEEAVKLTDDINDIV